MCYLIIEYYFLEFGVRLVLSSKVAGLLVWTDRAYRLPTTGRRSSFEVKDFKWFQNDFKNWFSLI